MPIHMSKILQEEASDLASGLALHPLKGAHSTMATRMSCELYVDPNLLHIMKSPHDSTHHLLRWLKGSHLGTLLGTSRS